MASAKGEDWVDFSLTPTMEAKILPLQKPKKKRTRSDELHDAFENQLVQRHVFGFKREVKFAKQMGRNWSFDFAWDLERTADHRPIKLAVEIEGLVMTQAIVGGKRMMICMGRHAMPTGIKEDMVKYDVAALMGWRVLRFDQTLLAKGFAINMTIRTLHAMGYKVKS